MNFELLFDDFIPNIALQNKDFGNIYDECELCGSLEELIELGNDSNTLCCRECFKNENDHEDICEKNKKCVGCDSWKCGECLSIFCNNCNVKMCNDCRDDDDSLCGCLNLEN